MIKSFLVAFLFFVCGTAWAQSTANGEKVYSTNCSMCHGSNGAGDGPVGKALKPNPADFNKLFATKKSSAEVTKFILNVLENGKPGTAMVAFKAISENDRKDVTAYLIGKHYRGK